MPTLREARIDVTTVPVEEIRDRITDKINENMFCTGCKYRWPCEQFKQLLTLKDMAYGYVDLEKSVEDLEKINPNFTLTPKTLHL